jgi:hypothetical protein
VYKGTSQNLQKKKGRASTFRFRPLLPKTRHQYRKWWLPLIAQALKTRTNPKDHSSVKFPEWLRVEVAEQGEQAWLDKWGSRLRQRGAKPNKPTRTEQ